MSKTAELGYGYLYHYNEYVKLWECVHRSETEHLFGAGNVSTKDQYVASGKTPEDAAANYIKKFGVKA